MVAVGLHYLTRQVDLSFPHRMGRVARQSQVQRYLPALELADRNTC